MHTQSSDVLCTSNMISKYFLKYNYIDKQTNENRFIREFMSNYFQTHSAPAVFPIGKAYSATARHCTGTMQSSLSHFNSAIRITLCKWYLYAVTNTMEMSNTDLHLSNILSFHLRTYLQLNCGSLCIFVNKRGVCICLSLHFDRI